MEHTSQRTIMTLYRLVWTETVDKQNCLPECDMDSVNLMRVEKG